VVGRIAALHLKANRLRSFENIKEIGRRGLGKLVTRLQHYASQYQEEQKRTAIAQIAKMHPTANITGVASIANNGGNPDAIYIGANSAVVGRIIIFPQGGRVTIGQKCFVGEGTRIWSSSSVTIGNYVLIAHNVDIHDNISHSLSWRERRAEIDNMLPHLGAYTHTFDLQAAPVVIEDDVWIGFGASVVGGVRIGRGAIVGAGTIVTKDVPAFTLVVGNPMRVIRRLDDEIEWSP
jgi:acetyltransferase-like isoleucine patch superfamily enzyme